VEWVLFIIPMIAIVLAGQAIRLWQRRRKPVQKLTITQSTVTPAPSEVTASPVTAAQTPLAAELHGLEGAFAPFGASTAHPRDLSVHPAFQHAADLLADPSVAMDTLLQYALGANWALSCAGLAALAKRGDRAQAVERVLGHFDRLAPWAMYFALEYFVGLNPRPPSGAPAVGAKDWWRENPYLAPMFRDYFTQRAALGDAAEFGPALFTPTASSPAAIKAFLEHVSHPFAVALVSQLEEVRRRSINRDFLGAFGRFWPPPSPSPASGEGKGGGLDVLIEPDSWQQPLAVAESSLRQTPVRSLLVSGERLVGKTSFLRLLARRVAGEGWSVFEASGADLMAGQQWFGQLEGRIRQTIEEATVAKRLIWYIPDLLQVAKSGTHQGQAASILDQILPAIVSGRLVVWTEMATTASTRLLQMRPALRGVLEVIALEAPSEEATLSLVREVAKRLAQAIHLTVHDGCADTAVGSARQYLNSSGFPGSALQLLKLTAVRVGIDRTEMAPADVLQTLSQLSGLPIAILDNRERIDLAAIRAFFASRVIGQDEAVTSVVARIAMLKAGLNDPRRPIGVFLFAGPTGTGKTELAKTTAEYLFGSVDRLIRLDMSEFQAADANVNILGSGAYGETDSLISRVRKQPFSVVLLDEFEKAHPRIWDLFLQVFDDGRLTDTDGQVADFRHCLIILTTNLGIAAQPSSSFGFAASADVFTADQVTRVVTQTFRPEFQNRLDKVIVFRPLTRDLMRVILGKELKAVLERRGLKDRAWAVEWEASALEFLLEQGFSPEMGARPLKRAIDQYVIAPLAETIVERRFPEGDQFVFFRSDGRSITAEFVDPDIDTAPMPSMEQETPIRAPAVPAMILTPRGTSAEFEALAIEAVEMDRLLASPQWEELKQRLAAEMSAADFWQRPERFTKLARLALMDRVVAATGTIGGLRTRLTRAGRQGHYSRDLVARLALQLHLIKHGIKDVWEGAPVEVALAVEPALEATATDRRASEAWCRELVGMYRAWSSNRHMQVAELASLGAEPTLLVSGFGAHRVLARECGLHILELAGNGASRATARVCLVATPLGDVPAAKLQKEIVAALDKAPRSSTVVRRYRRDPAPLVRSGDGRWRTGRLDAVLRGDFDLLAADESAAEG
jgi:ATP-dependent Clp protease ATP-binding subunit ClpC